MSRITDFLKRNKVKSVFAVIWALTLYFQPLIVEKFSNLIERIYDGENIEKYLSYRSSDEKNQHDDDIGAMYVGDSFILSGSDDDLIKVWNKKTGRLEYSLNYHSNDIQTLTCYGNRYIISGGNDKLIIIADLERKKVYKLKGHLDSVLSLQVKDNKIYSASADGEIRIWDIHTRELEKVIKAHSKAIYSISVTNGHILAASKDGTISIWDRNTLENRINLMGHKREVKALYAYGSDIAVSSGKDKKIFIWNLHSGNIIGQIDLDFRVSMNEIFIFDNKLFVASGQSEKIYMYKLGTDNIPVSKIPLKIFKGNSDHESIFVKNNCLYAGTTDGTIEVWSIDENGIMLGIINGVNLAKQLINCQTG